MLLAAAATPAAAQVGASVSVQSEYRLRGRPVSAKRPVASLDLAYDGPRGGYLGLTTTAVAVPDIGPRLLAIESHVGYARALGSGPVVDAGVLGRYYTDRFSGGYEALFVEVYAGVSTRRVAARVHVSPDYYQQGRAVLYAGLDAAQPFGRWRVSAHVGGLLPFSGSTAGSFVRPQYDFQLGAARALGPAEVRVAWTQAGPRPDVFGRRVRGRGALVIGTTLGF